MSRGDGGPTPHGGHGMPGREPMAPHHRPPHHVPDHHEPPHHDPYHHEPPHHDPYHHEPPHHVPYHHEPPYHDPYHHEPPHHHDPHHHDPHHHDPHMVSGYRGRYRRPPRDIYFAEMYYERVRMERLRAILYEISMNRPIRYEDEDFVNCAFGRHLEMFEIREILMWLDDELRYY